MTTTEEFHALLGDLSEVPADYIRDVAWTKRVLERWSTDRAFREHYAADPARALAQIAAPLTPEQVRPFIDESAAVTDADTLPRSARRYRAFLREKLAFRAGIRTEGEAADPRMAAWRRRQLKRCAGELGAGRSEAIVHAPAAFELSKGCTVGCWFCGVAAPKFDHTWRYTDDHATLWRDTLTTMRGIVGDPLRQSFLYWATDPLDNPDYEHFLTDFHRVLGRCPQPTTAIGHKDTERTRALLRLAAAHGSVIDRFSIIALSALNRLHEAFTAEELLRVECVPQNKDAAKPYAKSNAGRARRFAHKRGDELVPDDDSSTIACVSGFLLNMTDRSVRLVTPCDASDRWPLGYWVLGEGTFDTAAELGELLEDLIATRMRTRLRLTDPVRLRRDLHVTVTDGRLTATARGQRLTVADQPDPDDLADLLTRGTDTAEEFALHRERRSSVPLPHTLAWLGGLFDNGLLDEEPAPALVLEPAAS